MARSKMTSNLEVYFPHNAYAHISTRLYRMRLEIGTLAYGVYWVLLERLRLEANHRSEYDELTLCHDCGCDKEILYHVIHSYKLFDVYREEEDGPVYFESIELNDYLKFMEDKKRKRQADAKKAAEARWGVNGNATVSQQTEIAEEPVMEEKRIPVEPKKLQLDCEIETMKSDNVWMESIAEEFGRTTLEVENTFQMFRDECIRNGKKNGHKDIEDAMRHFRSWAKTCGILVKPDSQGPKSHQGLTKVAVRDAKQREEREKSREERRQRFIQAEKNKTTPDNYIRNKGYDPAHVTMVMLMKPGWVAENPPTHPEWIGKFERAESIGNEIEVPI